MFYGPATPSQFDNLLLWRRKGRARVTAESAPPDLPDLPEPRPNDDEFSTDSLDLYALSVGRTSGR